MISVYLYWTTIHYLHPSILACRTSQGRREVRNFWGRCKKWGFIRLNKPYYQEMNGKEGTWGRVRSQGLRRRDNEYERSVHGISIVSQAPYEGFHLTAPTCLCWEDPGYGTTVWNTQNMGSPPWLMFCNMQMTTTTLVKNTSTFDLYLKWLNLCSKITLYCMLATYSVVRIKHLKFWIYKNCH